MKVNYRKVEAAIALYHANKTVEAAALFAELASEALTVTAASPGILKPSAARLKAPVEKTDTEPKVNRKKATKADFMKQLQASQLRFSKLPIKADANDEDVGGIAEEDMYEDGAAPVDVSLNKQQEEIAAARVSTLSKALANIQAANRKR
jgi:hypothetical protein